MTPALRGGRTGRATGPFLRRLEPPSARPRPHRSWCGEQEAGHPPTNASSSSATPCWAWSWPATPTSGTPSSPRASWPRSVPPWSTPVCWPGWPPGLGVGEVLLLGRGEKGSGGRAKASILADAFEAVLGSVYLDAGWDAARELVLRELGEAIERAGEEPDDFDHKSRLQEKAVRDRGRDAPLRRRRLGAGPRPGLQGRGVPWRDQLGAGEGRSKKDAEQEAAAPRPGKASPVPELPEVETLRQDLAREVVGRKIKAVSVAQRPLGAPPRVGQALPCPARGPHDQSGGAARQVPAAHARHVATRSWCISG